MTGLDRRARSERRQQPLTQQPRTHRRLRCIEHLEHGALRAAATQTLNQLKIASRHFIQRHHTIGGVHHRPHQMRDTGRLQFTQIPQQRTGGSQRRR